METAIKSEIKRLSRRTFARLSKDRRVARKYRLKFERRTGQVAGTPLKRGPKPAIHPHFDPAYCARNANFLARAIWFKIRNKTYSPTPAINFHIPKPSGELRSIMAFTIPDAAVANVMLSRARKRNLKRLSPFSYAYHPERNVFDAVLALSGFISKEKLFAVQIDFKKYFDSIPTRYLKACVNDEHLISLTPDEKYTLQEFLNHRYADSNDYISNKFVRRIKGTPQGSSVSLLLANLANHQLDKSLEKRSGRFVRFADDVVALCGTYGEAQAIEKSFVRHCEASGLVINEKKSPGIAIIENKPSEIRSYEGFDYLGYHFTKTGLAIPSRVTKRIKSRISRLINIYLVHYPNKYDFNPARCGVGPDFDWDLLGLISETRRYLYGGLSEAEVSSFLSTGSQLKTMRGLMGFYPLLERKDELRELDGWLVNNLRRAMGKRAALLKAKYGITGLRPDNEQLILGTWFNKSTWQGDKYPEVRLPSFVRGWRAARKHYFTFGLENVEPPGYGYY